MSMNAQMESRPTPRTKGPRPLVAVLVATLLTPLLVRSAHSAPTPVTTCGANLNVPDTTYVLTADLVCVGAPAAAITISADNITFDLHGHTITGPGGNCFIPASSGGRQDTIGIDVASTTGARIAGRGGVVKSFGTGVHLITAAQVYSQTSRPRTIAPLAFSWKAATTTSSAM
jgi:hypothetical protein